MKVLHVLDELRPSGAEVMLRVAAPLWEQHGIECEILGKGRTIGRYAGVLEMSGYRIHHIPIPFDREIPFLKSYFRLLKKENYDVVHIHTEHANFWLAIVAKIAGVKRVVRTIHSVFDFKSTLWLERRIQRAILRKMRVVQVSIGNTVQDNELECFSNPTTLVYNWYDSDKFVVPTPDQRLTARRSLGINMNTKVFVSVGNCEKIKNHEAILNALSGLRQIDGSHDWLYLHVGQEQDGHLERALAVRLGIEKQVRFLGYQEGILPVLHAGDVFVMSSLREGFPIAAIEALATGMQVVLTNAPGLNELKKYSDLIILFDADASSLCNELKKTLSLPSRTENDGLASNESMRKNFSPERGVRLYSEIYMGMDNHG